jgi:hypothetical protein
MGEGTDVASGRASTSSWPTAVLVALVSGLAVLALYLIHPLTEGYTLPVGPDGPVYTWLARAAAATGLPESPGAGPGVPTLTLLLGRILGTDPLETVTLLGPVLAACCALAGVALIEAALGPSLHRALLAAVFTGAFTAYLAGGWLANVAMVAVFLAAAAAMALAGRGWHPAVLCAAMLGAAGLLHRVFFLVGAVILLLVVVGFALREGRQGRPWRQMHAARMAVALGGGLAVAAGGALWMTTAATIPGDTSQDGFFRRIGLRDLLLDRYRERFWGDAGRAALPVAVGFGLAGWAGAAGDTERRDGRRFLTLLWGAWAVLTVGGILVLAATGWGPPNRLLQFAFFLPIGAAAGAAALLRGGILGGVVAAVAAAAFVGGAMGGWFRQSPSFTAEELNAVRRAGRVIHRMELSPGVPLVFVVDTDQPAAAYHVTRATNLIRMGVPAERIGDVRIVVGTPEDVLERRATRTGDPEHDRIASVYLREAGEALDRGAILVLRPFNPAASSSEGGVVRPDVIVLSDHAPPRPAPSRLPAVEPMNGLESIDLVWRSVTALLVLGVIGLGWSRWGLREGGWLASLAGAPSAGMAVAVLVGVTADRLGLRLDTMGALLAVLAVGAIGFLVAARTRRNSGASRPQLRRPLDQQRR